MTKLVIIESPNKASKIKSYLGPGWTVVASYGHIRDLPKKEMGVKGPDYVPDYVTTARRETISKLKSEANKASYVYLATDPDREGEAIAWHLAQVLKVPEGKLHRVVFNEITKKAVNDAVAAPVSINEDLFMAQQGRRALDRLVGYSVSPVISSRANTRLSAGRVQSIAVKLIAERDLEIKNFKPTDHFGVTIEVNGHKATWDTKPYIEDKDHPYITDGEIAKAVLACKRVNVHTYKQGERLKKPPKPFTTLDLCREASNKLNLTTEKTMGIAQALFEKGLITYHRTDNHNLSNDGIDMVRHALTERGCEADLPDTPNSWKNDAGAQEAHEAIRPTTLSGHGETLDDAQAKVYSMIEQRTLACQMKPATYNAQKVVFESLTEHHNKKPLFSATASTQVYAGWESIYKDSTEREDSQGDADQDVKLPIYEQGDEYDVSNQQQHAKTTEPPAYYSESALLKKLDAEGVGRPSTYASILNTIKSRAYVGLKGKFFHITETGMVVYNELNDKFDFMDIGYTRRIEKILDDIAMGKGGYRALLSECDHSLKQNLEKLMESTPPDIDRVKCPTCEEGGLRRINGNNGPFWGCSRYSEGCKATFKDDKGKPILVAPPLAETKLIEAKCPKCDAQLKEIYSPKKKKNYYPCSNGCGFMAFKKSNGVLIYPDKGIWYHYEDGNWINVD